MAKKKSIKKPAVVKIPPKGGKCCFCIIPYGEWSDYYYDSIYYPAIKAAGLIPQRADDLYRPSTIVNDIWDFTKNAKVLLADLSGKNPNVFYELGLAHAAAKPVILITESMDDVPFDLRSLRIIIYDTKEPDWGNTLKESIKQALKETLSSPSEAILPTFLTISKLSTSFVTADKKKMIEIEKDLELLKREVRGGETHLIRRMGSDRIRRMGSDEERRIGPDEIMIRIKNYLKMGMSGSFIVRRIATMGMPENWVKERIDELKREK